MKRLTVHLANVKQIQTETENVVLKHKGKIYQITDKTAPKDSKRIKLKKTILKNTKTVRDLKADRDIQNALSEIRKKHTIAIAERTKGCWKAGQEMYHTAWQK